VILKAAWCFFLSFVVSFTEAFLAMSGRLDNVCALCFA